MVFLKILTSSLFLLVVTIPMVPAHADISKPLPEKFELFDFLITVFKNITNQFNIAEDERDDLRKEIKDLKKDIKDIEKDIKKLKKNK